MRVVLTRAAEDAGATAEKLRAMGHEPVLAPLGTVATLPARWPRPLPDALAATSAHAFAGLLPLPGHAADLPVFAVGERTAEAARQAGFREALAGPGDALALAAAMAKRLAPEARVFYAAGRTRKPALEEALRARRFRLDVAETYAIEPAVLLPGQARVVLLDPKGTCALHYSRATVERFASLARSAGLEDAFVAMRHLCLSADVAAPLLAWGARSVEVADAPREAALLDLLGRKG
jgi:uroporphyrinogen-III synthase